MLNGIRNREEYYGKQYANVQLKHCKDSNLSSKKGGDNEA